MQGLEKMLDDAFKKLPALPQEARSGLVTALPWLALAGGILSLLAAWYLYQAIAALDQLVNGVYSSFGYTNPMAGLTGMAWVSIAILVAQAVVSFIAFPSLRTKKKIGWDMMLWFSLATALYGIVSNLFSGYLNIGGLVFSLLGSAVGIYLLFQVRSAFVGSAAAAKPAAPVAPKTDKKE